MHQGVEKRDTTAFTQKRFPTPMDWFAQGQGEYFQTLKKAAESATQKGWELV